MKKKRNKASDLDHALAAVGSAKLMQIGMQTKQRFKTK